MALRNVDFKQYLNYYFEEEEEDLPEIQIINNNLQDLGLEIDDELCCLIAALIEEELMNCKPQEQNSENIDEELQEEQQKSLEEIFMQRKLILALKEINRNAQETKKNIIQKIILLTIWRRIAESLAQFIKENYVNNFENQKENVNFQILQQLREQYDPENNNICLEGFMIYIIKLIHQDTQEYPKFKYYLQNKVDNFQIIDLISWIERMGIVHKQNKLSIEQIPWKGSKVIQFYQSQKIIERVIISNYVQQQVIEQFRIQSQQRLKAFTNFMALYSSVKQSKQFSITKTTLQENISRDKSSIFQHPIHQTAFESVFYNFHNLKNGRYILGQSENYQQLYATILGLALYSEHGLFAELLRNPERILSLTDKFLPFMVQDVLTLQFQRFLDNLDGTTGWRIRCPVCRKIKYFKQCIHPTQDQPCSQRCQYIFVSKNYTGDQNLIDKNGPVPKQTRLNEVPQKGSQLTVSPEIVSDSYSNSKSITPLGFRFGNLLVNATLLLSAIINGYDNLYLWKLINGLQEDDKAENDPFYFLIEHINRDWDIIKKIMNCANDYHTLFILVESIICLQSSLQSTSNNDKKSQFQFDSIQQRDEYQKIIIQESIGSIEQRKNEYIKQYYDTDVQIQNIQKFDIQPLCVQTLHETLDLNDIHVKETTRNLLPNQLKASYEINKERIVFLLNEKTEENQFQILKRLIDERRMFQYQILQDHVWNIINWYQLIAKYLSNKYFAKEIESVNVYDFIEQNYKNEDYTSKLMLEHYIKFKESWNVLRDYLMALIGCDQFQVREIQIQREQDNSSILDFFYNLELYKNRIQNQEFVQMIEMLTKIQNDELDEIQTIMQSGFQDQEQNANTVKVDYPYRTPLHLVVKENILQKVNLDDIAFEYYFIKGLSHGDGNTIYSDFQGLQNEVQDKFLPKKCKISLEDCNQIYLKEYQTILSEISIDILQKKIPQKETIVDVDIILQKLENETGQDLSKLYHDLLQCFNLLKMIGGRPDSSLLNFFVNRMKISNQTPSIKDVLNQICLDQLYVFLKLIEKKQLVLLADKCLERYSDTLGQQKEEYITILRQQLKMRGLNIKEFRLILGRFIVRNLSSVNCGIDLTNYIFGALKELPELWLDVLPKAFELDLQDSNKQPIADIPINFAKSIFQWVNTEFKLVQEQEAMRKRQEIERAQQQQQAQQTILNSFDDYHKVPTTPAQTEASSMNRMLQKTASQQVPSGKKGTQKTRQNLNKI